MINELLVLRLSKDVNVWRAVVFAMLCCDLVHLYAVWVAGGWGAEFMCDVRQRRVGDWANTVILGAGVVLRVCFLVGMGMGIRGNREWGLDCRREKRLVEGLVSFKSE
jgi:hypothetical protein